MKSLFFRSLFLPVIILAGFACNYESPVPEYISIKTEVDTGLKKNIVDERNGNSVFIKCQTVNLGSVRKDTTVKFSYNFVNKSKGNIAIHKITGSCSCTTFDYKRTDILPNEESMIKVTLSTGLTEGFFKKEICVSFNTGKIITLSFYVNVI